MATLVSPGVSVTVTDESFFIPASAPTVPLIFVATAERKLQPVSGANPPVAEGTTEYEVVRTVTSIKQSLELYGVPRFLEDASTGAAYHGDARNEYGLFALNQFLGVGNRSYVIRANVNLNDDFDSISSLWADPEDSVKLNATSRLSNILNQYITEYNSANGLIGDSAIDSVDSSTLISKIEDAMAPVFEMYSFSRIEDDFMGDITGSPVDAMALPVYGNGFDAPSTGEYDGVGYIANNPDLYGLSASGSPAGQFTVSDAVELLEFAFDNFMLTQEFLMQTSLGANDAARRVAIVTALQAAINSNTDIRSETYDYNLILCPGFPEVVDELLQLSADISEEALVIADTPVDRSPEQVTTPVTGWAATVARQRSVNVAYYYPWALASNLDGKNVVVAPSGVALRTIAISDNVSFLWFAPAGTRRGVITGVSDLGYVSGELGGPTTFVSVALNQGQMDALYQYAASGDINPLAFLAGAGFVVNGQKTSAPAASAMDRINVSRLVKYIKRQLRINTRPFIFEPNDQLTRDNLKAAVDGFLGDLVVKRGLYDYATICDESNNTPDRIDRNEMYIDVAIKPVKAAEFLYIPIRIVSTGAEI